MKKGERATLPAHGSPARVEHTFAYDLEAPPWNR